MSKFVKHMGTARGSTSGGLRVKTGVSLSGRGSSMADRNATCTGPFFLRDFVYAPGVPVCSRGKGCCLRPILRRIFPRARPMRSVGLSGGRSGMFEDFGDL